MSEGKFNEEELLFIQEVLYRHGDYLVDLFTDEIEQKKLRHTDELLESIDFRVRKYGINPVLEFTFAPHGRFIEINYHKKSKNVNMWDNRQANRDILGIGSARRKKKKDTRWYAHNVYGSINRLLGILGSEFTEAEQKRIRRILDRQKSEINL